MGTIAIWADEQALAPADEIALAYSDLRNVVAGCPASLSGEVLNAHGIRMLPADAWERLSRECMLENPFYARQYVVAGLDTIDAGVGLEAFAVRAARGELHGLFPFRKAWSVAFGAANVYQFSGAPLVSRAEGELVVEAWVAAVRDGRLPAAWSFPHLPTRSELTRLLIDTASRAGLECLAVNGYDRPRLTRSKGGFEAHLGAVLAKSRRKEIERSIRRLGELGKLRHERHEDPGALLPALERFLRLERAGWKGEAGTAFLSNEQHAAFARAAFGVSGAASGLASIDVLYLNDDAIALSLNLRSGATVFTPKCTYDEHYRRYGPGIVLEYFVIEHFYRKADTLDIDAATTAGGHVVQGLWSDVEPMATVVIGEPRRARLLASATAERERAKRAAKKILARLGARR